MTRAQELKKAFYKRDFERRLKEKVEREDWIAWAKRGEKKPASPSDTEKKDGNIIDRFKDFDFVNRMCGLKF